MFYVVLPNLSLRFILPYELDQSGFYNLFFISKESGDILLLDTIKNNQRYFTPLSSGRCYDIVLLYNNGKYVKHNDVIFENGTEVDMSNQHIQLSDSISKYWKIMRSFDYAITSRTSDSDDISVSTFIIKGYVFSERRGGFTWPAFVKSRGANVKGKECNSDGYFEIDVEDESEQILNFSATVHVSKEINMKASCGIFLVMSEFGAARRDSQ